MGSSHIEWARSLLLFATAVGPIACAGEPQKPAPPPPVVSVAAAAERDVPSYIEFAGTLDALVNAEARARVAGTILAQNYREGSFVKTGQVLFTIDPAPFRAALLQAQGALEQAHAAREKAEADIARYTPLVAKQAATKEQLDNAIAAHHAALGQVAVAKGALDQAELNLGYTRVLSPVDGITDIAQVRVGNLVGQGATTLLTTVSSVDPIRFVFQLSEAKYMEYADRIKALSARSLAEQAAPSDDPAKRLELVVAGERVYPRLGYVAIVGRRVDPSTGTLTVQAFFPNPDLLLRPGQYGRARFMDKIPGAVVVPQRAVRELQGETQVAVVGPDSHVEVRPIKVGPATGGFVVVQSGLKSGERVIVDGTQKVKAGQAVTVTPADTSSLQLSSAPVELAPQIPRADAGPAGTTAADASAPR